jgi:hypothetical protein
MTKALVTQQSGNLATADILADFGRFLRLHTADGDTSPATILLVSGRASIGKSSSLGVGRNNLPAQMAQNFER